jgi:error-prone DNA polymerase
VERVSAAVQSFAVYGFPESHAISFALIAYASCWLKVHRAPEFYASLLNNQPMGFYSPATLVLDARRHGVRIRPASVLHSEWLCTIGEDDSLRLGLCYVRGLRKEEGLRIVSERKKAPFTGLPDFQMRTMVSKAALRALAKTGALNGLASHRRDALWRVEVSRDPEDLFASVEASAESPLQPMSETERARADYMGTGLTTGRHPMAMVREALPEVWRACDLDQVRTGAKIIIAGLVICRQRPSTAKGHVFVSLEDETGVANAVVGAELFEKCRLTICEEPFLRIEGIAQNIDRVVHIKALRIEPLHREGLAVPASHDFH